MIQEKTVEKKLSRAAIETLAIIVYHQPVTRAEIEEIRGVAFGTNTLEILMELNWVKPGGRKDVPGRPIQYVTTDDFLSHFNLQKLSDLPTVDELGAAGLIDNTNIDNAIIGTVKFYRENNEIITFFTRKSLSLDPDPQSHRFPTSVPPVSHRFPFRAQAS